MSIEAGRNAWLIGIHISDNPYGKEPGKSLWLKGWKQKQKQFENSISGKKKVWTKRGR
jgi:ribosome modulation factor